MLLRAEAQMRDASIPITFREAIREALIEEMHENGDIVLLGEDIGKGATWGTTVGLSDMFPGRVLDTPISESAIIGFSVGSAMTGLRPVPEIMFADLTTCAMDELVNQAAKMRYMTAGQFTVPLVVRIPCGRSRQIGAQGCQALESWFVHVPGLHVVVPSNPSDAKGLMKTALRSQDPVLFFEYRLLYSTTGTVDVDLEPVEFGKAVAHRMGNDLTILAYGRSLQLASEAADILEQQHGINPTILDPRTLVPLDEEAILRSVEDTGRLLIVEEECERASAGAWIAARIQELAFDRLKGPIRRVASPNTPKPVAPELEDITYPNVSRIVRAARETAEGAPLQVGQMTGWGNLESAHGN